MKVRTPITPLVVTRKSYLPHLLAIALLWSAAMTFDFYDQKNHAEDVARRLDSEFASCLRGEWRETTEQGVQLACLPVERFDPKTEMSAKK